MDRSKIKSYCQFCLIEADDHRPSIPINTELKRKFNSLTQKRLNTSKYSEYICCNPCLAELEKASDYRENLLKNQHILFELYKSAPTSHQTEDDDIKEEIKIENEGFATEFVDGGFKECSHCLQMLTPTEHHICPRVKVEEEIDASLGDFPMPTVELSTSTAASTKKRMKRMTEQGPFKCPECPDKEFAKKVYLGVHFREMHRPNPDLRQICPQCGKICNNSRSLHNHMVYHRTVKEYQCDVCSKQFISTGDLSRHKRIHDSVKPFVCIFCSKGFTQSTSLKEHLNIHYKIKFTCDRCGISLSAKRTLQKHMVKCLSGLATSPRIARGTYKKAAEKYKCFAPECDREFSVRQHLGVHLEKIHNMHFANFSTTCLVCQQEFATVGEYTVHYKTHTCTHICEICKQRFKTKDKLSEHLKTHKQGEERLFVCGEHDCGARFKILAHLKSHQKYKHSDGREIECEYCDLKFHFRSELNSHTRIHTNFKPFSCWKCEFSCSRSSGLQQHMNSVHSETHIYCCKSCRQPFRYQQELLQHEKEHS